MKCPKCSKEGFTMVKYTPVKSWSMGNQNAKGLFRCENCNYQELI